MSTAFFFSASASTCASSDADWSASARDEKRSERLQRVRGRADALDEQFKAALAVRQFFDELGELWGELLSHDRHNALIRCLNF